MFSGNSLETRFRFDRLLETWKNRIAWLETSNQTWSSMELPKSADSIGYPITHALQLTGWNHSTIRSSLPIHRRWLIVWRISEEHGARRPAASIALSTIGICDRLDCSNTTIQFFAIALYRINCVPMRDQLFVGWLICFSNLCTLKARAVSMTKKRWTPVAIWMVTCKIFVVIFTIKLPFCLESLRIVEAKKPSRSPLEAAVDLFINSEL